MPQSQARTIAQRARWGIWVAAAALLLSMSVVGWGIARSQAGQFAALEARFQTRQATAARFIEAYVGEVLEREKVVSGRVFAGPITPAQFAQAASDQGYDAAVLVNADGRLIATQPVNAAAVGRDVTTIPHIKTAVGGTAAVSSVVLSAARPLPEIGFAVPFDTPTGRRVFSGGYDIEDTPLAPFVRNALPFHSGQVLIVDSAGVVVASNVAGGAGRRLEQVNPRLTAFGTDSGSLRRGEKHDYVAQGPVAGTPWRLTFMVDEDELFAPLQGPGRWAPWVGLAAFALLALLSLAVLYRYLMQRSVVTAAEERRRAILDATTDAFVAMDDAGTIIEWNQASAQLLGWTAGEAIGQPLAELVIPPEDRDAHIAGVARFLSTEVQNLPAGSLQLFALRRDGSRVEVDFTLSRMRWGSGWHFHAFMRDITDAKRAEGEREAAAAQLRGIIENSQSLIYVKDLDGKYLLANRPFLEAFSVAENDLIGRDDKWLDPDLEPVWRANDLRARDGAYRVEEWSDAAEGRHWYESVKFPLRNADGELYAICGVSLDVTVLKHAALAMEKARDTALQASVQKSTFLANMSHEIRTPMNGVLGMADLLMDTELDADQRHQLQMLQESAGNLLVVINDILDFSKVEAGKMSIEAVDFDLRHQLRSIASLFASTARDKRLDFAFNLDHDVAQFVTGDPTRLRQILTNLLGNAVKFTVHGGIGLRVARRGGDTVRLEVIDSGIGIDPEAIPDLLTPFTQADSSTTRRFGGTGLGLAISQQLAVLMGGVLGVESEPGKGSTFWIELPLPAGKAPVGLVAAAVKTPAGGVNGLAGMRVLVVDDGAVNREVAKGLLQRLSCDVETVSSGYAALASLRANCYDVVLLDCLMPGLDGYETTSRIRAAEGTAKRTVVVALTASALAGDREKCLAAGMDDYLSKPLDPGALAAMLKRWRGRQPAAQVPPGTGSAQAGTNEPNAGDSQLESRLATLRERIGPAGFARIGTAFVGTIPPRIETLAEAVAAGDAARVHDIAHLVAGSCASIGAAQMRSVAQRLEDPATPHTDWPGLLEELQTALTDALGSIGSLLGASA